MREKLVSQRKMCNVPYVSLVTEKKQTMKRYFLKQNEFICLIKSTSNLKRKILLIHSPDIVKLHYW